MNLKLEVVRVRLSKILKAKAEKKAKRQDRTLSQYIRELIEKDTEEDEDEI